MLRNLLHIGVVVLRGPTVPLSQGLRGTRVLAT